MKAPDVVTAWLIENPEIVMALAKKIGGTRRANTLWTARTQYRSVATGRKVPIQATASSEEEARRLLDETLRERLIHEKGGLNSLSSVAQLIAELQKELHDAQLGENTLRDYGHVMRRAILPQLGDRRIEDLTVGVVNEWLRTLGREHKFHDARVARSIMDRACKIALSHGALSGLNPIDHAIPAPRNPDKKRRAVDGQQIELAELTEFNRLREALLLREHVKKSGPTPDNQLRCIVELWAASSRPSEVLALRVRDVNLAADTMTIAGTIIEGSRARKPWPKTTSGYRTFRLTPTMRAAIQRRLDTLGPDVDPDALLFTDRNGRPHDLGKLRKALAKTCLDAGLPHA